MNVAFRLTTSTLRKNFIEINSDNEPEAEYLGGEDKDAMKQEWDHIGASYSMDQVIRARCMDRLSVMMKTVVK